MNFIRQPRTLPGQSPDKDKEVTVKEIPASAVRAVSYTLSIPTRERTEIHDLTPRLRDLVAQSGIREGMVSVASFHTTTAVMVNENQPALLEDIQNFMSNLLPRAGYYRHNDPALSGCERRNADAHLKSVLLGQSALLSIINGGLLLGQWQSVLFAEFDGPQSRTVHVYIFGSPDPGSP